MSDVASRSPRWFGGPTTNRRAYAVTDVQSLRDDAMVVRAERLADPDDPRAYTGPVSLKLNTDPGSVDAAEVADRLRQVRAIDHPNLGRPIESFLGPGLALDPERADTSDDVFYVAARWEDGVPLKEVVPLPPAAALRLARDVAGAVGALHEHGLAHRDLHPGNVIVRPDGSAVVIDFGTVRPDDGTDTATIAGVVGFIAPDVVTGGRYRDADRWSVGMLVVYALLGHPQGSTPAAVLRRELEGALAGAGDARRAAATGLAMVDPDPARRPADMQHWVDLVERQLHPGRRRLVAVAASVLALGAVVAGALLLGGGDAPSVGPSLAPTTGPASSDAATGRAGPLVVADPPTTAPAGCVDPEPLPARLGVPPEACWAGPEEAFADGQTRRVSDREGTPLGVVVTAPDGRTTYLTQTMWQSYAEIAGRPEPVESPAYGGYPVGIERFTEPDAIAVRLDSGGLVLGPRDDTQMFWLPAQGVERWVETGCLRGELGFPASNLQLTFDGAFIEFQHGKLSVETRYVEALQAGERVPIRMEIPRDPSAGLPIDAIREAIVRQWGGQSWWIDAAGIRHWIADRTTWSCLGGDAALYPGADQLAGWTVWLFPLGAPATCPDGS